jgi:rRNA maturation RNase YbeY
MIKFNYLFDSFKIENETVIKNWIKNTVSNEGKLLGEVQYVFCSDEYLLEINRKYLNHDYLTDIITFPLTESETLITAEIYISIDRVKDNSTKFNSSLTNELNRVIIHGVLHLCGYDDLTEEEKKIMRRKEDYYLNLLQ